MKSYPMFYMYPAGEDRSQKSYEKEADIAVLCTVNHLMCRDF